MPAWLRLDCEAAFAGWTSKLPATLYAAWVKVLQVVKTWGQRGQIKYTKLLDHLKDARVTERQLQGVMEAADEGTFRIEDGDFIIDNWGRYQMDPTAADRKAAQRDRNRPSRGVTVTPVSHDYGTGRDSTGQDTTKTPQTPRKRGAYSEGFEKFWEAYPKKRGKDAAFRRWQALGTNRPVIEELLLAIEAQKKSRAWLKDGGQFVPYPATWLHGGRWQDEIEEVQQAEHAERRAEEKRAAESQNELTRRVAQSTIRDDNQRRDQWWSKFSAAQKRAVIAEYKDTGGYGNETAAMRWKWTQLKGEREGRSARAKEQSK